jgi:hypothetical protein
MKATSLALMIAALLAFPALAQAKAFQGVPSPSRVHVVYAPCPDIGGTCADTASAIIYLDDPTDRFARQHELGHLADSQLLDDAERSELTPLLGAHGVWQQLTGVACGDGSSCPSERFADAYATCRLGMRPSGGGWEDAYGYAPRSDHTQARVCATITQALARSESVASRRASPRCHRSPDRASAAGRSGSP